MPEIAYTTVGRNTIIMGLVNHITSVIVVTMSASRTDSFFAIVFALACLFFIAGSYIELKYRNYCPVKDWRFYITAAVPVLPLIGPVIALGLLYCFQKSDDQKTVGIMGFPAALFRLRFNILVAFLLLVFLFILFAFTNGCDETYYKKKYRNYQNRREQQIVLMPAQSFDESNKGQRSLAKYSVIDNTFNKNNTK